MGAAAMSGLPPYVGSSPPDRYRRNATRDISPASLGNGPEIFGFEAGAADERAIDVVERQDLAGILRVDRAAVEDTRACGYAGADRGVHFTDVGHCGGQPGADRPDRLIGDDQRVGIGA